MDNSVNPIFWLIPIGLSIWVGIDSGNIRKKFGKAPGNTSPAAWVIGTLLLWILFLPIYLYQRSKVYETATATGVAGYGTGYGVVAGGPIATRECPYCKEQMRRDASVCPHCRHDSPPWTWHEGRWWFRSTDGNAYWLDEGQGRWVLWTQPAAPPAAPSPQNYPG